MVDPVNESILGWLIDKGAKQGRALLCLWAMYMKGWAEINVHATPVRRGKRKHEESLTKSHMKKSATSSVTLRKVQSNKVQYPNEEEIWFNVSGRYIRFSISEFCLVTELKCSGDTDTQVFENRHSKLKAKYFSQVDTGTHEDVKDTFLSACQMPDLNLVEALPDNDVAMFGVLYFLTAYLFPRDYKKVVDHFLFVLVEDFNEINSFSWGKLLFQITLGALRDGLSRRTPHYRLRGMIVAFQAWI
ncbi:Hypothetical predicted protein [Olea europaea subsp. europaea]|uniref:DUF1985 domain-containing protein n=1 Tax=Olea europaea subsp. europaea TaxID=158383 RepID=A0A8S0PB79_OLEEU|nr:Hypothetical predicted protein [Olea europaea subsp. europaea]